ncbi:tripartite tricarboxylate transporter TctB family protein [Salipiger sp.]|uniref:tripartite tricarboxylate transporter TctB family protein n=1 Tax=Salipiger sp. TaxID=2078585 RepID=UPI003A983C1A
MKIHDALLGLIFVALGATVIAFSYSFPTPRHLSYGPGLFPRLTGGGLALSGAALILMSLRHRAALVEWPAWLSDRRLTRNVLLIPGACLFYFLVADTLGFQITATLLLLALLLSGGVAPLRALLVSAAVIAVTTLLFVSILHVPLPWGVLAPISGLFIW